MYKDDYKPATNSGISARADSEYGKLFANNSYRLHIERIALKKEVDEAVDLALTNMKFDDLLNQMDVVDKAREFFLEGAIQASTRRRNDEQLKTA